MNDYNIRNEEISKIQNIINNCEKSSSTINIYGSSGTGKTFLIKKLSENILLIKAVLP